MAYSVKKVGTIVEETAGATAPKWVPAFLSVVITTAYQLERWYEKKLDTFTLITNLIQMYAVSALSYLAAR